MYPLAPFQSVDREKICAVIRAYPLATLISAPDSSWPIVTQVPLVLDERAAGSAIPSSMSAIPSLIGHFDGNNPHGAVMRNDPRVTCLFHGPNHYMSPSIYPTEQYPGWNYFTVHVRALARPIDRERTRALLFRLADLHEPAGSGYVLRPDQQNFERFLGMVFGFELEVVEARAIFKLAQDKGPDHYDLAAVHLAAKHAEADLLPFLRMLLSPSPPPTPK